MAKGARVTNGFSPVPYLALEEVVERVPKNEGSRQLLAGSRSGGGWLAHGGRRVGGAAAKSKGSVEGVSPVFRALGGLPSLARRSGSGIS